LHRASIGRGLGGEHDTREIVLRTMALRAERARLLGHPHHASWVAEDATAGSVEAIDAMLRKLAPVAVANAGAEAAELSEAAGFPIEAWDRAFYAERVRRERFDIDTDALGAYFELERVLHDGVFHAAGRLYGLWFAERHDLPRYHPDVRVFDVFDSSGQLGLFVADFYARDSKRGGAWMNSFVTQSHLLGTKPVVLNTLNIAKPADGEPTLLTVDNVRTLFHEFGHALHGLFSDVRYPTFSGTSVPRDFVEFPSQVNEMWLEDPEILASYARHHETGAPLPPRSTSPRRCWTRRGTGWARTTRSPTSSVSRPTHSRRQASSSRPPRRATAPRTSTTCSAATARRTTRTSGARCSTPTPSSGSPRTAACAGRTATSSAASCSPAAARWTRWRPTAPSAAATRSWPRS
jgi:peptidyl-dipeptidase Dcp